MTISMTIVLDLNGSGQIIKLRKYISPRGNHYLVTNKGQVFGVRGEVKGTKQSKGYMQTTGPGKEKLLIHRIIAEVWCIKRSPDQIEVDHLDRNRCNNHPSNLEWVTPEENKRRKDMRIMVEKMKKMEK